MKYHFNVFNEEDGYSAQGVELDTCFTQGDTLEELYENMLDALNVYIDEPEDSDDLAPLPDPTIKCTDDIVEVSLDPQIALAFLIRYNRIKDGLTQQDAADKLGFENIYSYQRLESSKANPTFRTLAKIKKLFPAVSVDYVL